jgi:NAD(P)-dependent dehydrogenase (short-subunit alcohol dehydrogenase family)
MNNILSAQHVVIVGGASHMGLATAEAAIKAGARVTLVSRDAAKLQAAAKKLGAQASWLSADASANDAFAVALKSIAPIDHLMVTMSVTVPAGGVVNTPVAVAQMAFERLWASYRVIQLAPQLLRLGGSVTLLSGSSGRRPVRGYGVWTALHGAIEALAKGAMLEIAPLRLNVLSPGGIGMRPDRNLVHRAGRAEDVAAMAVALMGNAAITGAVVDVDSGERLGNWSGS